MQSFLTSFTYLGIALVLLASGFGVPLPEDIPLIMGGYLSAKGVTSLAVMLPLTFFCLLGSDAIVYGMGRFYGRHVSRLPVLRRYLTKRRLRRAEVAYRRHGGKTLLVVRFVPGLRTAAYFTAGTFRIGFFRFLLFDGIAAVVSAPTLVLAGYFFADYIDRVFVLAHQAQAAAAIVALLMAGLLVVWQLRKHGYAPLTWLGGLPARGMRAVLGGCSRSPDCSRE